MTMGYECNLKEGTNMKKNGTMAQAEKTIRDIAEIHGWEGGDVRQHAEWDKLREEAKEELTSMIDAGEIGTGRKDGKKPERYALDLINEVRRMGELNGGTKYAPETKRGPRDGALKVLRQLLSSEKTTERRDAIQKEIDRREAEIKPKQAAPDLSVLPAEVRERLGL
jgi:hypothetical protein